jgi:sRNA-binding protein
MRFCHENRDEFLVSKWPYTYVGSVNGEREMESDDVKKYRKGSTVSVKIGKGVSKARIVECLDDGKYRLETANGKTITRTAVSFVTEAPAVAAESSDPD